MEKERDGEAKLQGLALAEGLQRRCWESPVSLVAGWGLWDAPKHRGHTWALPGAASLWDCCSPTTARHPPAMQRGERGCKAGL